MKRILFVSSYAATLLITAALYLGKFRGAGTSYSLSMLLGTVAFTIFANQFLLATKPRFAVEALGTKGLLSFHGTMAVVGIVFAVLHRVLKVGLFPGATRSSDEMSVWNVLLYGIGFSDDSFQAQLGNVAFWLFLIAILIAAFLMANTFWMKIPAFKKLKDTVYGWLKLTYPRMRDVHNIVVLAFFVIIVHILLASTSGFSANPFGASWMILWAAFCFGSYLRYRIVGRKSPAKPKPATQG